MRCRMHLLGLALCLLALGGLQSGCAREAGEPPAAAPAPAAAPTPPPADTPYTPAGPVLAAPPQGPIAPVAPGDELQVSLTTGGAVAMQSVIVTLCDAQGDTAGQAWLDPADGSAWQGPLTVAADAAPGDYALTVTLNDAAFTSGNTVHQSLYLYDAQHSQEHYLVNSNDIQVGDGTYSVSPLGSQVSSVALSFVRVQAP
jgi:hypothetical protein